MKYRKIPVEIEAFKYEGDLINLDGKSRVVPDWMDRAWENGRIVIGMKGGKREEGPYIKTLEGEMHVSVGDYIIQGVNGELYPCKPDIFEKTYAKVDKKGE